MRTPARAGTHSALAQPDVIFGPRFAHLSPACSRRKPITRDHEAHGLCLGNVIAFVLLVIGYPMALAMLARLRSMLVERRVWWFAALEAATASIAVGWLLYGRPLATVVNGLALDD